MSDKRSRWKSRFVTLIVGGICLIVFLAAKRAYESYSRPMFREFRASGMLPGCFEPVVWGWREGPPTHAKMDSSNYACFDSQLNLFLLIAMGSTASSQGPFGWPAHDWMMVSLQRNLKREETRFELPSGWVTIPRQQDRLVLVALDGSITTAYMKPGVGVWLYWANRPGFDSDARYALNERLEGVDLITRVEILAAESQPELVPVLRAFREKVEGLTTSAPASREAGDPRPTSKAPTEGMEGMGR